MSQLTTDPWLREASAAFEEVLERERVEGRAAARERLEAYRQAYLGLRAQGEERPLAELTQSRFDAQIGRARGVWVLWMLREALGELTFLELQQDPSLLSSTTALRQAVARRVGAGLDEFFEFWIGSTGLPEYHLERVSARPHPGGYLVTLRVANRGTGSFPAPAVVRTEEGARHQFDVAAPGGSSAEISYGTVTRPVAAAVDPEGDLLGSHSPGAWRPVRVRRWWIF